MTEDTTRDHIADWHAQFAPAPVGAVEGEPRPDLADQKAVEHFAGDDGVFAAPDAVEKPADASADDASKAKAKKAESAA